MARPRLHSEAFLRWAGSKRQLLPVLSRFWRDDSNRYVEPFAGSCCLFFHLRPQVAILGDINQSLIATYRSVKYRPHDVAQQLGRFSGNRKEYLRVRATDCDSHSAVQIAARFIYLNRYCFNGLYRTNLNGQFNVPFGGEKSGQLPSVGALRACSAALRRAKLFAGDFSETLSLVRAGDFVYMDPPFSTKSRRVFNEYDAAGFGDTQLACLRRWMERLADMRVRFLVSYAETPESDVLRRGFKHQAVDVRRCIAGFAGQRRKSREVLIFNDVSR